MRLREILPLFIITTSAIKSSSTRTNGLKAQSLNRILEPSYLITRAAACNAQDKTGCAKCTTIKISKADANSKPIIPNDHNSKEKTVKSTRPKIGNVPAPNPNKGRKTVPSAQHHVAGKLDKVVKPPVGKTPNSGSSKGKPKVGTVQTNNGGKTPPSTQKHVAGNPKKAVKPPIGKTPSSNSAKSNPKVGIPRPSKTKRQEIAKLPEGLKCPSGVHCARFLPTRWQPGERSSLLPRGLPLWKDTREVGSWGQGDSISIEHLSDCASIFISTEDRFFKVDIPPENDPRKVEAHSKRYVDIIDGHAVDLHYLGVGYFFITEKMQKSSPGVMSALFEWFEESGIPYLERILDTSRGSWEAVLQNKPLYGYPRLTMTMHPTQNHPK